MDFYGGEDWRTKEGAKMSRCIKRLVEEELVKDYQRDSKQDEETRRALEEGVGASWREDQGVAGRSYILRIVKEEWGNLKPSFLRNHRGLRGELGVGWIQNLKIDLEPTVQNLLGEEWRDEAEKYIRILEEEEQMRGPLDPKEGREEEGKPEDKVNEEEEQRNKEEEKKSEANWNEGKEEKVKKVKIRRQKKEIQKVKIQRKWKETKKVKIRRKKKDIKKAKIRRRKKEILEVKRQRKKKENQKQS